MGSRRANFCKYILYSSKKETVMKWEDHTLHTMKRLHQDENYEEWSRAIKSGEIEKFSGDLEEILGRLAGMVISEFEVDASEKGKIVKIMELAAVAGKTL